MPSATIMVEIAATAPLAESRDSGVLRQRILSAVILAPPALAAAWFGSWAFVALAALAAALMGWEWSRMCLGRFGPAGIVLGGMGVVVAVLGKDHSLAAFVVILLGAVIAPLAQRSPGRSPLWMIAGAFYIGLPTLTLVWLRELGWEALLWLILLVWATDIGAYAAGRSIGGPKLLPRVSPKKTWAGLLGGVVSAALVGVAAARVLGDGGVGPVLLGLLSGALAVVAQAGDLAESWVKRHFGIKDSSNIIPGHGGVFDRLDGLLATAPVVALLCLIFGGGLPLWR